MYSFDVDKGVFSTHFDIIIVNMISQSFWYPWGNCYAIVPMYHVAKF